VDQSESLEIFPYIHTNSNNVTLNDQLRRVTLPDVNPRELPSGADFSMCAGEFVEIYADQKGAQPTWPFPLTHSSHVICRGVGLYSHVLLYGHGKEHH
jgi:carnosine N-methyltransferase